MKASTNSIAAGIEVPAPVPHEFAETLSPEALGFVATLHQALEVRRREAGERVPARGGGEVPVGQAPAVRQTGYFEQIAQCVAGGLASTTALTGSTEESSSPTPIGTDRPPAGTLVYRVGEAGTARAGSWGGSDSPMDGIEFEQRWVNMRWLQS